MRLLQQACRSGWKPITEVLSALPGPHFERRQALDAQGLPTEVPESVGVLEGVPPEGREPLVLAVFIGGVTFGEIAALRWLNAQPAAVAGQSRVRYVVATTKLVSGGALLEAVVGEASLRQGAAPSPIVARGLSPRGREQLDM